MLYFKSVCTSNENEWVVFLHGAGGSSSVWFKQIKEFAKRFNILLVDLRGHGRSQEGANSQSKYSFNQVSADILAVMDEVGIKKAHFVGLSLGTVIMQQLALKATNRIKSMVMGGAITRLDFKSRFLFGFGNFVRKFVPNMWLYRLFARIVMPRKQQAESRNVFIKEARRVCEKHFKEWFRLIAQEMAPYVQKYFGYEIPVPTLYIMGEQDHMFLPSVKAAAACQKNAVLDIIKDCGHVCNVEKAREFNLKAIEFIQNCSRKLLPGTSSSSENQ